MTNILGEGTPDELENVLRDRLLNDYRDGFCVDDIIKLLRELMPGLWLDDKACRTAADNIFEIITNE